MLDVRNLKTHFRLPRGEVARAVDGVSFSVERGETVCLVGESGCGKSVSAFSIMQLLPRNASHPAGEIFYEGSDILKMSVDDRRALRGKEVSMIFQEPGASLNPVFTVGRQVSEALEIHERMSRSESRRRVVELFTEVGIPNPEARYDAFPHQLSGGMKQRVMIAIALACRPEWLSADEPTTALDVTIQAQILKLIRSLQEERNMSVLLITHNLRVVNQVADRVLVMYAGRIVESADRHTLFTAPQHPYTKKLLRAIPGAESRGSALEEIGGRVPPATRFPDHCRFADRCSSCFDPCRRSDPELRRISGSHEAACFLIEGDPGE